MASPRKRWMMFVDGENFAIRAAKVAGSILVPGQYYRPDVFVWMPGVAPKVSRVKIVGGPELDERSVRAYYFTALTGDHPEIDRVRDAIRGCGFDAHVFKKKEGRAKQVDIALAAKALVEAAKDTYDVAVLIAGDEDYVPLVQGIKELGKAVYLTFFNEPEGGLSAELRRASDAFFPLGNFFRKQWTPSPSETPATIELLTTGPSEPFTDLSTGGSWFKG